MHLDRIQYLHPDILQIHSTIYILYEFSNKRRERAKIGIYIQLQNT